MNHARIDRARCVGCGMCADVCPRVFALGADSIARGGATPSIWLDDAWDAAQDCPVAAIRIEPESPDHRMSGLHEAKE